MRRVDVADVAALVSQLYQEANFNLPADVIACLERAHAEEKSPIGRDVIAALLENAKLAADQRLPLCQDTGLALVFMKVGQEVELTGGLLADAVNAGIARAREEGHLRASVVSDPCFERSNTGTNTPAILHTELVAGDGIGVTVMPKGGGSENMSRVAMLKPADGLDGIVRFAVETVDLAGANPCPPVFLGVGVGGTLDRAAVLAKLALLRPAGEPHPDGRMAEIEQRILEEVNRLGIGPGGFGGSVTCMAVAMEQFPCHIASLPVAVNVQCNSHRRASGNL